MTEVGGILFCAWVGGWLLQDPYGMTGVVRSRVALGLVASIDKILQPRRLQDDNARNFLDLRLEWCGLLK
jgi:hypothetical protein